MMDLKRSIHVRDVLLSFSLFASSGGFPALAQECVTFGQEQCVTFDDRDSLLALHYKGDRGQEVRAAPGTWVEGKVPDNYPRCLPGCLPDDVYQEKGMLFLNGVTPPDPALGTGTAWVYNLMYEDPKIDEAHPPPDPENQHRYLSARMSRQVIQMTYEPDKDGVRHPFTIKRIRVLNGVLNIGILSNRLGIAVYNNLTPGDWNLLDGDNVTRVTLEEPVVSSGADYFAVDGIVFAPDPPTVSGRAANQTASSSPPTGEPLFGVSPPFHDPTLLDLFSADFAPPAPVDVIPGEDPNVIDISSRQEIEVAIITTEGLDARRINPSTVRAGHNTAKPVRNRRFKDVNGDGKLDLLVHFRIAELGIFCSDTQLSLEAQTFDHQRVGGVDFIVVDGCSGAPTPEPLTSPSQRMLLPAELLLGR